MKRLLIILLLISSIAKAQTDDASKYTNYRYLYGNRTARLWADSIAHIPGDTLTNAAQNCIAIKGGNFYVKGATKWDLITGSGGGADKVDSVGLGYGLNTDTLKYYINGTAYTAGYLDKQDGLISGGVVTWSGSGLIFDVTPAIYRINGVRYTSSAGSITLDAADPSNPRIDVIAVNSSGQIVKITGDAASNPVTPQVDPTTELLLTSVQVAAGASTPTNVSATIVYDENTEWTITPQSITIDANNTTAPYHGTKDISTNGWSNLYQVSFTNGSLLTPSNYASVKLFVRLKAFLTSNTNITITLANNSTVVSSELQLTSYGLSKTTVGTYQNISIPISAFNATGNFNNIRIRFTGSNGSGVYLDYIQLQSGVAAPPTIQGLQNAYANISDGTNTAVASGSSTFTFRTDNTLSKTVANNDATYGDNLLLKVDTSVIATKGYVSSQVTGNSGTLNANVGSGYRWLKPGSQGIKTAFNSWGILIDSTSNTDGLTYTVDSSVVATKYYVNSQSSSSHGVTVLKNYVTQTTSTGSGTTNNITIVNIPANTLANDGDGIEIEVAFTTTGTDTKTVNVDIGSSSTLVATPDATTAGIYIYKIRLYRTSSTAAIFRSEAIRGNNQQGVAQTINTSFSWTSSQDLKVHITSTTAASITINYTTVKIVKE